MKNEGSYKKNILSSICAALVTLLAAFIAYEAQIPNPVIILAVVMIFFTAQVSNAAGAVSGICILLYALYFFSIDHSFVRFNHIGMYKCCIIVVSLAIIYLMVATIKKRKDEAMNSLMEINRDLEEENEVLQNESDHDALTGILNRRGGSRRIAEFISIDEEQNAMRRRAILAEMDIDNFKTINDVYGHDAGDQTLKYFVSRMEKEFQSYGILIRVGGDEFQILLFETDGMGLADIERHIREFSKEIFEFKYMEQRIKFHISCGYSEYPVQGENEKELYHKADSALYYVKINGKHSAHKYEGETEDASKEKQQITMRNIAEDLPVAFMVYHADESEKIIVVSESLMEMCECNGYSDFMDYSGGTFRSFVHPDDAERVERSISNQIKNNHYELDEVNYRIKTKNGKVIRIHDIGRLVHDPDLGDLFYVILYDENALTRGV